MMHLSRQHTNRAVRRESLPTVIIGAGTAGRAVVRAIRDTHGYGLTPIGFLDDDPHLRRAAGLPILGRFDDVAEVARHTGARAALVAVPSMPAGRIAELIEAASSAGLLVRYLPSFLAAVERDMRLSDLRGLRVEHLLGRPEVHIASDRACNLIRGRRVLVTGAGGSIGSELCRQITRFRPAALYLLDHDESNLHTLQLELTGSGLLDSDDIIVADIRDRHRIDQVFAQTRPELVFHAAAHKHLPLLERHPCEGVKTNVLGTQNLVDAAVRYGTERFVLISTDKAADPTSVLGATKRLAELVVAQAAGGATCMASVRFGNVLGSRGSLLSVLAKQVANDHTVTVTHPDVTRFFMTVEEAVGLVLEAATMAEYAETFVLDMGEPVAIVDLVHKYAEQLHMSDVTIRFTGLRPGEKLNEKVFSDAEVRLPHRAPEGLGHPRSGRAVGTVDNARALVRVRRCQRCRAHAAPAARDVARVPADPLPANADECGRALSGRLLMFEGRVETAGELVDVRCANGRIGDLLSRAVGHSIARPDADPREPTITVDVQAGTAPFDLRGLRTITRGAAGDGIRSVLHNACGSGFDLQIETSPRLTFTARYRPTKSLLGANMLLRSRFALLAGQTLLHYPALWRAGWRDRVPLHVAVLASADATPMLAGPGGVGKSTVVAAALGDGASVTADNVCAADGADCFGLAEPLRIVTRRAGGHLARPIGEPHCPTGRLADP